MLNKIDQNLWISASAGSGKTKTLTDRFLLLLLNGVSPQKILCVTFTRSAAAEMMSRISEELSAWVLLQDEELKFRLAELVGAEPDLKIINLARNCFANFLEVQANLHIGTIHSFCQHILNKFPFESKIHSNCKVMDDFQNQTFIEQAKLLLMHEQDLHVQEFIADTGDMKLAGIVEKILFINSIAPHLFESPNKIESYMQELQSKLGNFDADANKYLSEIKLKIVQYDAQIAEAQGAGITFFIELMQALKLQLGSEALEVLNSLTFTKANTPRQRVLLAAQKAQFPELDLLIKNVQAIQLAYMRACDAFEVNRQTKAFLLTGHHFLRHYNNLKQSAGCLDYSDLITKCLNLLEDETNSQWIRCHLNSKFSHIMVDEAQDINLEQWKLIRVLLEEFFHNFHADSSKTLFVVGDLKQSIYSFQGTSPYLFTGMEQAIKAFGEQFNIKIHNAQLNKSFRSDEIILNFVDKVFALIKAKNPDYFFEETCHIATKTFPNSAIELWPAILGHHDEEEAPELNGWQLPKTDAETCEEPYKILAKKLAIHIKDNLAQGCYKPSEIMILVRKRDAFMEQMIQDLKLLGVPVAGMDRILLNQHIAVEDLLALAKFILHPHDDYNLACLLKSPIFGVSEEELFDLCQRGEECLWNHMQNIQNTPHPEAAESDLSHKVKGESSCESYLSPCGRGRCATAQRVRGICSMLEKLLASTSLHSPHRLFSHVLDVLRMRTKFVARFGLYINQILDEFLEACLTFELEQSRSLLLFVQWFEGGTFEVKQNFCTAEADEVRIMTVHAAKGLQAKFVILPDTISMPQKNTDKILFNPYTQTIICGGPNKIDFCRDLAESIELQTMQEYYRILYVALTRASERLLICGWSNRKSVLKNSWYAIAEEAAQALQLPAMPGHEITFTI